MADTDDKKTQDLKARLGLLKSEKKKPAAEKSESKSEEQSAGAVSEDRAAEAPEAATDAAGEVEHEDYEEYEDEAEPSGSTPGGGVAAATGAEDLGDLGRPASGSRLALVGIVLVVVLIGAAGGYFLGKVFESRGIENARIFDAQRIQKYVEGHKHPQTQKGSLEAIEEHQAAISAMAAKATEAKESGNLVAVQSDLLPFLGRCADYDVSIDVSGAFRGAFFNGELVPELFRFSASVERLHSATKAVSREAGLIAFVLGRQAEREKNPGGGTRKFLLEQREIDGVPWSAATRVGRMMEPERKIDPTTGEEGQWEIAVLEEGEEKGKLVQTTSVALLNVEPEIREVEGEIQQFAVARVLDRILELHEIAKSVNPRPLLDQVKKEADKDEYFTF